MMFESRVEGRERFVSHAVREIRNRLPEAITGEKRVSIQYRKHVEEIRVAMESEGLVAGGAGPIPGSDTPGIDHSTSGVILSRDVSHKVSLLVEEHRKVAEVMRESIVRLFEGAAPDNKQHRDTLRPIAIAWFNVTQWFMARAHAPAELKEIPEGELIENFRLFEGGLMSLVNSFYEVLDELDEILDRANA